MRILITGGAGFIGSNLVTYLLADAKGDLGIDVEFVLNLDKLTYAGNRSSIGIWDSDSRYLFVCGDIGDSELVGSLLRFYKIDAIVHLAAESHVDRSIDSPEQFIMTNLVGTYRLLEAFRGYLGENGNLLVPDVIGSHENNSRSVFLHVSTDEVFGSLGERDPRFCEETAYAPNSPYSASKAGSDHLARAYHHTYGVPVVTTNCSNNYGPFQFPEKLMPLMIRKILKGESLPIYGDGSNIRDWIYVKDHCRALCMALLHGKFGESYLIGGNCERSNLDVIESIIEAVRSLATSCVIKSSEELITFVKDRPGHDLRYAVNSSRIENELGWIPMENFSSGIYKTVQWYLEHETWVQAIEDGSYRGERLGTLS